MIASDDPIVPTPTTLLGSGALKRSPSMCTHASSMSDAAGYSSWSMWFFRKVAWMSASASGSIHVVTNDARLRPGWPSSARAVWRIS